MEDRAFSGEASTGPGLDILVITDEPEQLMRRLGEFAGRSSEARWRRVAEACERFAKESLAANEPGGSVAPES